MKYNTISSSTRDEKMKKSSFTIYADMDLPHKKMANTETEIATIRGELEIVQKALKLQTRRCRQLVTEYTKRLQQKEQQYQSEKSLRDDQLAKVLRALIIFEARLKQEQKFISHQLKEKDYIIRKQSNEIKKLLANQYCKNCNQYYSSSLVSLDSEYQVTDYQSSLDSSSDIYATVSEKSFNSEETGKFVKNNNKGSLGRKGRKIQHKKSVGSYFEVLKMRSDATSPCSMDDSTSNDYDSLPSITDKISEVSDRIEGILSSSTETKEESQDEAKSKISDSIPVFDAGDTNNDNWYASASDQEDDEQRDIYRNNPVLECMNQILLQNINDSMNSPPKTPNLERKSVKKVKFSDEEESKEKNQLTKENLEDGGYYETPIQKTPNFYETPQSIYSNDYEQILSKCSETFSDGNSPNTTTKKNHFYVDLDGEKKPKPRTPPALPPKPANLILKYKLQKSDLESEPDYCSISELNLPTNPKKINVVAEINPPSSQDVIKAKKKLDSVDYDPVLDVPPLVVKKCVEKLNIQLAKQTPIKPELSPKKNEPEIPKLPQVSEIIIPDEGDEEKEEERISHDNYVKNNSQILKLKNKRSIVMGTSVSNLISGFNNQLISEISKKPVKAFPNLDKTPTFDLSQNFEEFKLDECDIEEYNVNDIPEEEEIAKKEENKKTRVELIRAIDDAPSLNANSVELLKKQLELQKNKVAQENQPTYEHFLECTGLSSKAILTPSRLLSNHKSMLKPKDIKLRSKVNRANLFDRHSTSTIKYWSEPYI